MHHLHFITGTIRLNVIMNHCKCQLILNDIVNVLYNEKYKENNLLQLL